MTFSQIKDYSLQILELKDKIQEAEANKYIGIEEAVAEDRVDRTNMLDSNSAINSYVDERTKINGLRKIKYTTIETNYEALTYNTIDIKEVVDGGFLKAGNLFYHTIDGWDSLDVIDPDPVLIPNNHIEYDSWTADIEVLNIAAYWSMDSVPEIPTDTAKYLSNWSSSTDGWLPEGGDTTLTFESNKLKSVSGPGATLVKKNIAGLTVNDTIKIKLSSAEVITNVIFTIFGIPVVIGRPTQKISSREWLISLTTTGTYTDNLIYIQVNTNPVGPNTVYFDFVYAGTGNYLANSLTDNSGNAKHGRIYGATPVVGISNKALAFDGINDWVPLNSHPITNTSSFSISAWASTNVVNDGIYREIFSQGATAAIYFGKVNSGTMRFGGLVYNEPMTIGSLDFYVATHSGGQSSIYKNGVLVASGAWTFGAYTVGDTSKIGDQFLSYSEYWNGIIDELRVYSRALTADEVKYIYYKTFAEKNMIAVVKNAMIQENMLVSGGQTVVDNLVTSLKGILIEEVSIINSNTQKTGNDTIAYNNAVAFRDYLTTWLSNANRYTVVNTDILYSTLTDRAAYLVIREAAITTYMTTDGTYLFTSRYKLIAKRINKFFGTLNKIYRSVLTKNATDKSTAADQETLNDYKTRMVSKEIVENGTGDFYVKTARDTDAIESIYSINKDDAFYIVDENSTKLNEMFEVRGKSKSFITKGVDENTNAKTVNINVLSLNKKVSKAYLTNNKARAVKLL